jgi:diaminobutyrate-2-oxoglutarate transaminase
MKSSGLDFPKIPDIVVEPPGPKSKQLLDRQKELESKAVLYPLAVPLALEAARGAAVKDADGNTYIDFFGGIAVLNVGHSNPIVLKAVREQEEKLIHALDFPTTTRIKLAEKLVEIAPGGLKGNSKVLFGGPTGSDAVEAAIKLAKYHSGRCGVIAFEGSYAGQTGVSLALSSTKKFKESYVPLAPEIHFVPYGYCYRCAFELGYPDCDLRCVKHVRHILEDPYSGIVKPAAIIAEPIQGEGGIIVPPEGWLSELKRVCEENDVLLIADEIQAGLGRTGKMFACEHWNTTPDIMTMAKALGGIGLPLAACVYNKRLDTWEPGAHLGTFRGHVLAMAAGLAAIDYMQKNRLLEHAEKMGRRIQERLEDLTEESKYIGEVRGKGLMIGVEFVKSKENKQPWKEIVDKTQMKCFKKGLLIWKAGHYANVARFLPPLVITEELVDKGIDIFVDAVKEAEREF